MNHAISRRSCLAALPAAAAAGSVLGFTGLVLPAKSARAAGLDEGAASALDAFPAQDPTKAREIVGASHRDLERVTALLKQAPQLANATWDWGFGDWETPLGAAAHTGRVQIAHVLMEHGARPDIFAFAMLGKVEAVRAMIESQPGLQRTRGPHGLTLMHHARAGGDAAASVVEYLATVEGADVPYEEESLSEADRAVYLGEYAFGAGPDSRFRVLYNEKQARLSLHRGEGGGRNLFFLGNHTFHPVGAPDARLVFEVQNGRATRVQVSSPAPVLAAERVG